MIRARILAAAVALLASPAFADDAVDAHVWRHGCEGCTRIEPPAYMADQLAALARERDLAPELSLLGPTCRDMRTGPGPGTVQICRFELVSGCVGIDVIGHDGRVTLVRLGGLHGMNGCAEAELRRLLRLAATAVLRCRDEVGRQRSIDILMTRALDASSAERVEAFARDPETMRPANIEDACGLMRGSRAIIERADGGARQVVLLEVDP